MQLSPHIYMVGSGKMGLRLTNALDCNVYLVHSDGESILIDAGGGVEPERIAAQIQKSGLALESVKTLLLTHIHADHSAGARFWHDTYGVQVICANEGKNWMESGDKEINSLRPAIEAGIYPPGYQYHACPVARGLDDGDEISCGSLTLRAIETPGHARSHLSFLLEDDGERALFGGDLIFSGGKISLLNTWDSSIQEYSTSMAKVHALQITQLFAGHGQPLLANAHEDVQRAHQRFQKLGIPRTIN